MKAALVLLRSQDGFVLALTVWILAAITVGAGFFSLWASRTVELARAGQVNLQNERDLISTRSTLLYLLATQPVNLRGLTVPNENEEESRKKNVNPLTAKLAPITGDEIVFDDRPYKGFGGTTFSIQDEGGLIGLNVLQPSQASRLLGLLGVPLENRDPLIDKLLDYIDRDSLHRLNGAEAVHYEDMGLPAPANRFLFTSWETRNVLGWGNYQSIWEHDNLPRLTTVASGGIPSFNTAPALVLQSIAGVDTETADKIIQSRSNKPFSSLSDINRAAGKVILTDSLGLHFLPTSRLRMTLWSEGDRRMKEIHVQMTPVALNGAPWLIDYELTIPPNGKQQRAEIQDTGISFFTAPLFAGR